MILWSWIVLGLTPGHLLESFQSPGGTNVAVFCAETLCKWSLWRQGKEGMRSAVEERVLRDTPAQRWAEPTEIGEVCRCPFN